jgi:NAD-dependent DNA ligase
MDEEIARIVETLTRASDEYYNSGESFLSDAEYDALERQLRFLDPTNELLIGVGATVRGEKVRLPFPMPSLDQLYDDGDITNWVRNSNLINETVVITDKLDGVSIMLVYNQNGDLQIAFSRGDGVEGQDVTRHVRQMKNAPKKVSSKLVVRAEVVIAEAAFQARKTDIEFEAGRSFKNSRNFVAGQMNASEATPLFYEMVDIVAYEIMQPVFSKFEQLPYLHRQGFKTPHWVTAAGGDLSYADLSLLLKCRLSVSPYTLDGVVVDVSSTETRATLENEKRASNANPAYARKFKIVTEDNIANATVREVYWRASKTGYLKPTVIVNPIELLGVTIQRATGFNAKFIVENNIGPGAVVEIVRSGDVIPYIRKVITPATPQLPNVNEFGTYHWSDQNVDFIMDAENDDVLYQKLIASFKCLGVEFLGGESLRKLFDAGYTRPEQIIVLPDATVASAIGSTVMAKKGMDSVRACLASVPMARLAAASGVYARGLGEKRFEKVIERFGTLFGLTVAQICEVEGFSDITAPGIVAGEADFKAFLDLITGFYTVATEAKTAPATDGKLSGMVFVFTGFRDADAKVQIEALGGEVADSVSKKTTHLVAKDTSKMSGKLKKALDAGIAVINREELQNMV